MSKINKHYDKLNRPSGDLFPDLYVTDNAFSKDQNFSQGVESPTDNKNPAKGEGANLIDFTYIPFTEKKWRALKKTHTQSFLLICSICIETWMVYTIREGKVKLRTWSTDLFLMGHSREGEGSNLSPRNSFFIQPVLAER
jgi:hypothetical protein